MQPLARAISTAGGVVLDDVGDRFMLRARPGVFVAGEMLDWEAPTGGYLLQACFATGRACRRWSAGVDLPFVQDRPARVALRSWSAERAPSLRSSRPPGDGRRYDMGPIQSDVPRRR